MPCQVIRPRCPPSSGRLTLHCISTSILLCCHSSWCRRTTSCPTSTRCSHSTWAWATSTVSLAPALLQLPLLPPQRAIRRIYRCILPPPRRLARPAATAVHARAPTRYMPPLLPLHMRCTQRRRRRMPAQRCLAVTWPRSPRRQRSRRAVPLGAAAMPPRLSRWSQRAKTERRRRGRSARVACGMWWIGLTIVYIVAQSGLDRKRERDSIRSVAFIQLQQIS